MSNTKQSSVEWLIGQLIFKTEFENLPHQYVLMSDKDIDEIIKKAKAMHKEEIMKAHGKEQPKRQNDGSWKLQTSEQYYNETYNQTQ